MKGFFLPMIVVMLLFSLISFLYFVFFFKHKASGEKGFNGEVALKVGNAVVTAEVADTPAKRSKGLMFRESLSDSKGMFFVFDREAKHSFWMLNTKIPLDIIWINSNLEIIYIKGNVSPCTQTGIIKSVCTSYFPPERDKYVLEVNAGWAERNNVTVGDKITIMRKSGSTRPFE